jgi:hypothetical protein
MEQEIRTKIKDIYYEMSNLPYVGNHYTMSRLVQQIIDLLDNLKSITENETLKITCEIAINSLLHTQGKEVLDLDDAYKHKLKKNAPQIRSTEYDRDFRSTINQIGSDIGMFLI